VAKTSDSDRLALLTLLAARLERLSADSLWARRASGARGSVLKALEAADQGRTPPQEQLDDLIDQAFLLLRRAAQEIPDREGLRRK
jgi:uncharacterized membrane-anchored protein